MSILRTDPFMTPLQRVIGDVAVKIQATAFSDGVMIWPTIIFHGEIHTLTGIKSLQLIISMAVF